MSWDPAAPGVLVLPSGRLLRGRRLPVLPAAGERADFTLVLTGRAPTDQPGPFRWLRWPDFRLPADGDDARAAFGEVWSRAAAERVEVACPGGRGRTGTALACIAVLDGVPAAEAVDYVRRHFHHRAVETPGQRRYVAHFPADGR